jgi:phosphoserine phosphatase
MKYNRKAARTFLKRAIRTEYNSAVYEAKLTPEQEEILNRHIIKDETLVKISLALHCPVSHIKEQLSNSYDSIYKTMGC